MKKYKPTFEEVLSAENPFEASDRLLRGDTSSSKKSTQKTSNIKPINKNPNKIVTEGDWRAGSENHKLYSKPQQTVNSLQDLYTQKQLVINDLRNGLIDNNTALKRQYILDGKIEYRKNNPLKEDIYGKTDFNALNQQKIAERNNLRQLRKANKISHEEYMQRTKDITKKYVSDPINQSMRNDVEWNSLEKLQKKQTFANEHPVLNMGRILVDPSYIPGNMLLEHRLKNVDNDVKMFTGEQKFSNPKETAKTYAKMCLSGGTTMLSNGLMLAPYIKAGIAANATAQLNAATKVGNTAKATKALNTLNSVSKPGYITSLAAKDVAKAENILKSSITANSVGTIGGNVFKATKDLKHAQNVMKYAKLADGIIDTAKLGAAMNVSPTLAGQQTIPQAIQNTGFLAGAGGISHAISPAISKGFDAAGKVSPTLSTNSALNNAIRTAGTGFSDWATFGTADYGLRKLNGEDVNYRETMTEMLPWALPVVGRSAIPVAGLAANKIYSSKPNIWLQEKVPGYTNTTAYLANALGQRLPESPAAKIQNFYNILGKLSTSPESRISLIGKENIEKVKNMTPEQQAKLAEKFWNKENFNLLEFVDEISKAEQEQQEVESVFSLFEKQEAEESKQKELRVKEAEQNKLKQEQKKNEETKSVDDSEIFLDDTEIPFGEKENIDDRNIIQEEQKTKDNKIIEKEVFDNEQSEKLQDDLSMPEEELGVNAQKENKNQIIDKSASSEKVKNNKKGTQYNPLYPKKSKTTIKENSVNTEEENIDNFAKTVLEPEAKEQNKEKTNGEYKNLISEETINSEQEKINKNYYKDSREKYEIDIKNILSSNPNNLLDTNLFPKKITIKPKTYPEKSNPIKANADNIETESNLEFSKSNDLYSNIEKENYGEDKHISKENKKIIARNKAEEIEQNRTDNAVKFVENKIKELAKSIKKDVNQAKKKGIDPKQDKNIQQKISNYKRLNEIKEEIKTDKELRDELLKSLEEKDAQFKADNSFIENIDTEIKKRKSKIRDLENSLKKLKGKKKAARIEKIEKQKKKLENLLQQKKDFMEGKLNAEIDKNEIKSETETTEYSSYEEELGEHDFDRTDDNKHKEQETQSIDEKKEEEKYAEDKDLSKYTKYINPETGKILEELKSIENKDARRNRIKRIIEDLGESKKDIDNFVSNIEEEISRKNNTKTYKIGETDKIKHDKKEIEILDDIADDIYEISNEVRKNTKLSDEYSRDTVHKAEEKLSRITYKLAPEKYSSEINKMFDLMNTEGANKSKLYKAANALKEKRNEVKKEAYNSVEESIYNFIKESMKTKRSKEPQAIYDQYIENLIDIKNLKYEQKEIDTALDILNNAAKKLISEGAKIKIKTDSNSIVKELAKKPMADLIEANDIGDLSKGFEIIEANKDLIDFNTDFNHESKDIYDMSPVGEHYDISYDRAIRTLEGLENPKTRLQTLKDIYSTGKEKGLLKLEDDLRLLKKQGKLKTKEWNKLKQEKESREGFDYAEYLDNLSPEALKRLAIARARNVYSANRKLIMRYKYDFSHPGIWNYDKNTGKRTYYHYFEHELPEYFEPTSEAYLFDKRMKNFTDVEHWKNNPWKDNSKQAVSQKTLDNLKADATLARRNAKQFKEDNSLNINWLEKELRKEKYSKNEDGSWVQSTDEKLDRFNKQYIKSLEQKLKLQTSPIEKGKTRDKLEFAQKSLKLYKEWRALSQDAYRKRNTKNKEFEFNEEASRFLNSYENGEFNKSDNPFTKDWQDYYDTPTGILDKKQIAEDLKLMRNKDFLLAKAREENKLTGKPVQVIAKKYRKILESAEANYGDIADNFKDDKNFKGFNFGTRAKEGLVKEPESSYYKFMKEHPNVTVEIGTGKTHGNYAEVVFSATGKHRIYIDKESARIFGEQSLIEEEMNHIKQFDDFIKNPEAYIKEIKQAFDASSKSHLIYDLNKTMIEEANNLIEKFGTEKVSEILSEEQKNILNNLSEAKEKQKNTLLEKEAHNGKNEFSSRSGEGIGNIDKSGNDSSRSDGSDLHRSENKTGKKTKAIDLSEFEGKGLNKVKEQKAIDSLPEDLAKKYRAVSKETEAINEKWGITSEVQNELHKMDLESDVYAPNYHNTTKEEYANYKQEFKNLKKYIWKIKQGKMSDKDITAKTGLSLTSSEKNWGLTLKEKVYDRYKALKYTLSGEFKFDEKVGVYGNSNKGVKENVTGVDIVINLERRKAFVKGIDDVMTDIENNFALPYGESSGLKPGYVAVNKSALANLMARKMSSDSYKFFKNASRMQIREFSAKKLGLKEVPKEDNARTEDLYGLSEKIKNPDIQIPEQILKACLDNSSDKLGDVFFFEGERLTPRVVSKSIGAATDWFTNRFKVSALGTASFWINNRVGNQILLAQSAENAVEYVKSIVNAFKTPDKRIPSEILKESINEAFEDAARYKNSTGIKPFDDAANLINGNVLDVNQAKNNKSRWLKRGLNAVGTALYTNKLYYKMADGIMKFNAKFEKFERKQASYIAANKIRRDMLMKTGQQIISTKEMFDNIKNNPEMNEVLINKVEDILGNYRTFTPLEKNAIKRLVPFMSWYKTVARTTYKLALENPQRLTLFYKLLKDIHDSNSDLNEFQRFVIRLPFKDARGNYLCINLANKIPLLTLVEIFNSDNPISGLNPIAKSGLEASLGKKFFADGSINSIRYAKDWDYKDNGKYNDTLYKDEDIRSERINLPAKERAKYFAKQNIKYLLPTMSNNMIKGESLITGALKSYDRYKKTGEYKYLEPDKMSDTEWFKGWYNKERIYGRKRNAMNNTSEKTKLLQRTGIGLQKIYDKFDE